MNSINLDTFPKNILHLFDYVSMGFNNWRSGIFNVFRSIKKDKTIPDEFPFINDHKEKSKYLGRDAIAYTGGKDSMSTAILSKIEKGVSPILLTTKNTSEKIKKQAKILGSKIIEFPEGKTFHSSMYVLAPYYLQDIEFSGRILIGSEAEINSQFKYYPVWDEALQAYSKFIRNYNIEIDFMSLVSDISNTMNLSICKSNSKLINYLVSVGRPNKKRYLKILSKSLNVKDYQLTNSIFSNALKDNRRAYREQMEQAIYTISGGKRGKPHNWIFKINERDTFGQKSRNRINKIINEKFEINYNDNVPNFFKRKIW